MAAATLHASVSSLKSLASSLNVPENRIPISLTISISFSYNRTDPIEDERESPQVLVQILTIPRESLGKLTIPEFLNTATPEAISLVRYSKRFAKLDSIFNWFKQFETVLLSRGLEHVEKERIKELSPKDVNLDEGES